MNVDATPVLWVCGPPGVGKTTVAWELYRELAGAGAEVGYVDIDQLGICYPEPDGDPGRFRLAADNLRSVVTGFRAAGAQAVVVSGVVDPVHGVHGALLPDLSLTTCRLRADADELSRRLVARQGDQAPVTEALAVAGTLDANDVGDLCIDTTGLAAEEVVRLVQERTSGWNTPVPSPDAAPRPPVDDRAGSVLWLCGPTGVGKSAAGFDLYLRYVLGRQVPGAFVDLDQLGFYRLDTQPDHQLRARILADLWRSFRAAGAECLTIVGPAEDEAAIAAYARTMPGATITVCRLHAGRDALSQRLHLRGRGQGWAQPGDPLKDQPPAVLSSVVDRAVATAGILERTGVGDVRVDTDRLSVAEVADAIIARTGWPGGSVRA